MWVLDIFIDGADERRRSQEVVHTLFAAHVKPALVLFTNGDLDTVIRNLTSRHEQRVRTHELICSGMEETDAAFARLVTKLRANWPSIVKVYDDFEVPDGVALVRITGDTFASVNDVSPIFV